MIKAGEIHNRLFRELKEQIVPGVSCSEIYDYVEIYFEKNRLETIANTYSLTININNTVYHGLPREQKIESGDIITLDVCFSCDGVLIDGAATFLVGDCPEHLQALLEVSRQAVIEVIKIIDVGVKVSDVLHFLSDYVSIRGFFLFPGGMGHGIGKTLHERPFLSLVDFSDLKYKFKDGDFIAIEPIVLLHKEAVVENGIGEGVVSDGNVSSQFEVTIYIKESGQKYILNDALLK